MALSTQGQSFLTAPSIREGRQIFRKAAFSSKRGPEMTVRTEKEKMLAGERYNCLDPELEADRQKTKKLLRLYNLTENTPERETILQQLVGKIGQNSIFEPPFYCPYGQNIYIGDHVHHSGL